MILLPLFIYIVISIYKKNKNNNNNEDLEYLKNLTSSTARAVASNSYFFILF